MSQIFLYGSPIAYGINRVYNKRKNDRLYGDDNPSDEKDQELIDYMKANLLPVIIVGVVILVVGTILPVMKGFKCGDAPTSLGMTGKSWGIILLILSLLATPLGWIFGIIFLIFGKCLDMS